MFFFKKASFHTHHMIGRNFACFGQSYNHIPGHGALVRKDLLNKYTMEWTQKFTPLPKCKAQMDYFVGGYRLYVLDECKEFFKLLLSSEYQRKRATSPSRATATSTLVQDRTEQDAGLPDDVVVVRRGGVAREHHEDVVAKLLHVDLSFARKRVPIGQTCDEALLE